MTGQFIKTTGDGLHGWIIQEKVKTSPDDIPGISPLFSFLVRPEFYTLTSPDGQDVARVFRGNNGDATVQVSIEDLAMWMECCADWSDCRAFAMDVVDLILPGHSPDGYWSSVSTTRDEATSYPQFTFEPTR